MRTPSRRTLLWGLVLAVGVGGGLRLAWWLERRWPYYHFRTVERGVLYRSAQLDTEDLAEAIEDFGIRTVVNLRALDERGPWHVAEQETTARHGALHVDIPLRAGRAPTPEQAAQLCALLDDPERRPLLVHCHRGSIRAASVEGLYRREYLREDPEVAFERVEAWSHDLEDYPDIARFIRTYVPRVR